MESTSRKAMHVVAARPLFLSKDLAESTAKSQMAVEKMVEGRLRKYYEKVALMEQKFVKNNAINIKAMNIEIFHAIPQTMVDNLSKEVGSPVKFVNFLRIEVGEGTK
ncbi:unnamed protein product [Thlaspi arvense]|uniref:Elongation factor Ts, mitochondrial n=1 Tax=Thlaspi arvense TaxID=13288 RepID=A0AAU9SQP9_THLAR|nr:unnamed protein product [Thlaspi arvense]